MLYPPYDPDSLPELSSEEILAMAETVARVKDALAEIVAREQKQPKGLISNGYLSREGLDTVVNALEMGPVSDQEWQDVTSRCGRAE